MTTIEYPIDAGILASYFGLILLLLWRIHPQLKSAFLTKGTGIFYLLALVSFGATWTYMVRFFCYSYDHWKALVSYPLPVSLNSLSLWLHETRLFESAWRQVSVGHWQWLWSHQLCSLTVSVWTPILAIEGYRRQIPHVWAYMLLGQVVAISTASSLAFAVILASTKTREVSRGLLRRTVVCVVGGLVTVVVSPFVAEGDGFMPNLVVMHLLLILPLLPHGALGQSSKGAMMIYALASGANLIIYLQQWCQSLATLASLDPSAIVQALVTVFFHHPAQSSISSDIVCMQLITITWIWTHRYQSPYYTIPLLLTPLLSASVTLPLFFSLVEYHDYFRKQD